jgi:hypothetical protein
MDMNKSSKLETSRGPGLYLSLLAAETAGIAIILLMGVPIYHEMMRDLSGHKPQPGVLWWAWAGVILVLSSYILRIRLRLPLLRSDHAIAGHIISFVARLSFVAATSTFSLVFLNHFGELNLPPRRMVLILALLFSLFCWNLELERLAKALMGTAGEPQKPEQS